LKNEFFFRLDACLAIIPPQEVIAKALIFYHEDITKRAKNFWQSLEEINDRDLIHFTAWCVKYYEKAQKLRIEDVRWEQSVSDLGRMYTNRLIRKIIPDLRDIIMDVPSFNI